MVDRRPVVVISCLALEDMLRRTLPPDIPMTFLGYELHTRPKDMCPAIQARLDSLPAPSVVLLGYGLCGNGVVGVRAGEHILVIPRTHDCIAIFLGSFRAYEERFRKDPGTFYLNKGWLESGDGPLFDYQQYVRDYGEETANDLIDMLYRHYRRLCYVAFDDEELTRYKAQIDEVAVFSERRLNMRFEVVRGNDALVSELARMPARLDAGTEEFVVIPPGGVVRESMFHRTGGTPAPTRRGSA